ncbi:MAG: type IV pilin [Candidatus Bathyarchaeota archaeon]|nr:type IV pilin [Candidatus Bathyarchaeota archaeon]
MKSIDKLRKRKGVSPVIATVILVAVTITVAVAVAYWMSGIAGQYTQFEKVEIQGGYAIKGATGWNIIITLKNSGTSTATLISCFLNEQIIGTTGPALGPLIAVYAVPVPLEAGGIGAAGDEGITIASGDTVEVTIGEITFSSEFSSSGTTINVKLHSAAGMDYIRLITLP